MRKMKDSGLQWIGQIPEEWAAGRMKDVIGLLTDYTANGSFGDLAKNVQYLDDGFARLVRLTDLRENLTNANGIFIDEPTFNYLAKSKLKGGDILVANVGAYSGLFCEMPKVEYPCSLAPNMFLIRTNKRMIQHFLFYVGSSNFVWEQLVQKAVSSAQPKLNKTDIKTTFLPIPPITEQQKIADFLDEKCSEIDSIRSDIQKQIDILNDYKKSVITEAVIKGLNPKAKLKDSGIEWIGKIPEGWMIKRLGTLASSKPYSMVDGPFGSDMKNEEYVDEGIPIIQLTNIKPYYHNIETLKFITEEKHKQLIRHTAEAGDIAIAKMMPAGRACILSNKYHKYVVAADAIRFKVNESNDNRFILYALNTYCMTECEIVSKGSTRIRISLEIARKLNLAVPPLSEQKAIADYLDEKCSAIDATIADKQKQLETLDEYKKSLIFEYVTGKKEVS